MLWDIGVGILLGIAYNAAYGIPLGMSVGWGIVFSLLPDIDMLGSVIGPAKKLFGNHQEYTHYPLLYIPVAVLVGVVFGWVWASFLFLGAVLHLIHDTFLIGTGIRWVWPFSYAPHLFYSQDHKHRHKDQHWIRTYYGAPTLVSVLEAAMFVAALGALYFYAF